MDQKPPIHISKRIFDIVFSSLFILLLLPLHIFFLAIIFVEHVLRGMPFAPLFYAEVRWSAGEQFNLYKYNIFDQKVIDFMRSQNKFIHTKDLERMGALTLTGKILRLIYLDESPQFINVLIGDMSIVGPRPMNDVNHRIHEREGFVSKNKVKAGITGYYQAVHKSENSKGGSQEELDTYYVNHYLHNPWYKHFLFDLKIIFRTILVLIMARGI